MGANDIRTELGLVAEETRAHKALYARCSSEHIIYVL